MHAPLEIENPITIERPVYRSPETFGVMYKPTTRCLCGCEEVIDVIELRTHEGEPVASEACFLRIAYNEGWLRKVAV